MSSAPRLYWRLLLVVAGAAVCGVIAGRLLGGSTTASVAVLALLGSVVWGLAYWTSRRLGGAVEELRSDVAGWRTNLAPRRPFPADDSFAPLRTELDTTRQHLLSIQTAAEDLTAALRRDTALLHAVLGTMVEGVVVLDGAAQLLYVNPAARRLLHLGPRDVTGRLLQEVTRSARLDELVRKVLDTRAEQNVEFDLPRENCTLTVSAGPLPLQPRPGVVLVLHDVTQLRELERMRRDFVSNVSHELKTPLTSIQAYADSLLDGALDDPEINRQFIGRIVEQSERLSTLILNLIGLSRLESQQESLVIRPVNVQETVNRSVATYAAVASGKGVQLDAEVAAEPLTILADAEGLLTLLDNLVRNAVHYTPEGGRVTVRAFESGEEVVLEVIDTGIGISKELQSRVFERFFRVDKARSRDAGGTGLGLSIVKHLAGQFNGRVELESELNRGSVFRVVFPQMQEEMDAEEKAEPAFTDS